MSTAPPKSPDFWDTCHTCNNDALKPLRQFMEELQSQKPLAKILYHIHQGAPITMVRIIKSRQMDCVRNCVGDNFVQHWSGLTPLPCTGKEREVERERWAKEGEEGHSERGANGHHGFQVKLSDEKLSPD